MNMENKDAKPSDLCKFNVLLNGNVDLQQQLEDFKKICDSHEKHRRKRCKRRYYQTGLIAQVIRTTSPEEFKLLMDAGARTFFIDAVMCFPKELDCLITITKDGISEYQHQDYSSLLECGIAYGIEGDSLRMGRMHNDCPTLMEKGDVIYLTCDDLYKYQGFKDVAFIYNLKLYYKKIKLNDKLIIGKDIKCKVVKKLTNRIAVLVTESGLLSSYDFIELPRQCYLTNLVLAENIFKAHVNKCVIDGLNFLVVPNIRCLQYLKALRMHCHETSSLGIIGAIDFGFIRSEMLDLMGFMKLLDYLWIPNFFTEPPSIQNYIYEDVIPISKCLKKPIIGSVPLQRCSDFKRFEGHPFIWKIDTILIQKSTWCGKYPIIVKKLLPIRDYRMGVVDNCMALKSILTSYQSIVNFIIRTISSIECYAIFISCKCASAAAAFARVEIYCPVYVVFAQENPTTHPNIESNMCMSKLALACNLRRNLQTIVYTPDMNKCGFKPIEYAIWYARKHELVETGDFIISIEICKEDVDNVQYGLDGDVAILRAFYLPMPKFSERFKYAC